MKKYVPLDKQSLRWIIGALLYLEKDMYDYQELGICDPLSNTDIGDIVSENDTYPLPDPGQIRQLRKELQE